MGASFELKKAISQMKPCLYSYIFLNSLAFVLFFYHWLFFLDLEMKNLWLFLVMLGSASTVTCFVMAKNMGYTGVLSSNAVMLTTLLSGFTLTFWIWVLRILAFI